MRPKFWLPIFVLVDDTLQLGYMNGILSLILKLIMSLAVAIVKFGR